MERFTFDNRWRYAAGVGGYDGDGRWSFVHTVLVDMRERLRHSGRPDRVFEVTRDTAAAAGLVGHRRVLDSTPLYDAVATMDTVTLIRSALRGLLAVAGSHEAMLARRDACACLDLLEGRALDPVLLQAATLLAAVVGQDLEEDDDGLLRIARRVARDRIISTVDPEARHGHKTRARSFDGYKGHIAIDPDSEIITANAVTTGNVGDAAVAGELLADCRATDGEHPEPVEVFGDCAYGTGAVLAALHDAAAVSMVKVKAPTAAHGMYSKDAFMIDLEARTVTCPDDLTVFLQPRGDGGGAALFGSACTPCPLRLQCTESAHGRVVSVGPYEAQLAAARERQHDAGWQDAYRATRPKVERKIAHLMRRRHGGRRARVRGRQRVAQAFGWLSAAVNLARLAVLGVAPLPSGGWAVAE